MATATPTTKLVPAVIVGGGRVGRALQDIGNGQDFLVKRGESVPLDFEGPILVCTRNDDLDAVLEATPPSRWNGTPTSALLAISFRCYVVELCDSSLSVNVEIEWLHFDLYGFHAYNLVRQSMTVCTRWTFVFSEMTPVQNFRILEPDFNDGCHGFSWVYLRWELPFRILCSYSFLMGRHFFPQ